MGLQAASSCWYLQAAAAANEAAASLTDNCHYPMWCNGDTTGDTTQ